MAFPDTMKPVVLNATTQLIIATDFYLRDVCIVSLGDTLLDSGSVAQIDESNYLELFPDDASAANATYKKLSSFYKYASNKPCYILELGAIQITPIVDNYENLKRYAETLTGGEGQKFSDEAWLKYLYTSVFSNTPNRDEFNSGKGYMGAKFNQDEYDRWWDTYPDKDSKEKESIEVLRVYASTALTDPVILDSTNVDYLLYLQQNNTVFKGLMNVEELKKYLAQSPLLYDEEAYKTWLYDEGESSDEDTVKKINEFKAAVVEGEVKAYWYVIPDRFRDNEAFIDFVSGYGKPEDATYFVISLDTTKDPSAENSSWAKYAKVKSAIGVWDNSLLSTNSLSGGLAGKFASSVFDISETNMASPFNYKTLVGSAFTPISSSLRNTITQEALNFGGSLAGNNVLLNGRTADGRGIDYWYQWDLVAYYIDLQIITLLLNGVNNPNYAIRYNQNGIDTIKASVEAVLNKMVAFGCLTEFGTHVNQVTNNVENLGSVYAIPYHTYIKNSPEDYNNEVYKGISFYSRIGKYIRQITLSISLG